MKKFEYTLQPILNIKAQSEKIERDKLAKVMYELNMQKEKLNKLIKEADNILNDIHLQTCNGIKAINMSQYDIYLRELYNLINEQNHLIYKLENDVESIRENLIKTSREKKVLENIKDKRFSEYQYKQNIEQSNLVDEQINFKMAKSY